MTSHTLSRKVVQQLTESGEIDILGVLIHVLGDDAWIASRPTPRPVAVNATDAEARPVKQSRSYWKRPRLTSYSQLIESSKRANFPRIQLVDEDVGALWVLSEEQLAGEMGLPLGMKYPVKQLIFWKELRDNAYLRIEPIVKNRSLEELLYDEELDSLVADHAKAIGASKSGLWSLLNQYLYAGGHKRGLLPRYNNSGAPGQQKFPTSPSGRRNTAYLNGESAHQGFLMTELDRQNCYLAWSKFKKPGVSVPAAFVELLRTYYAKSVEWIGPSERKVTLLPADQCPSEGQFEYFGRAGNPMRAPALIGLSSKSFKNNMRGFRGTAQSGVKNAMQIGLIDSTSDDQTLCSESSTLLMLKSTWSTRIMDVRSEYIFGEYTSFDPVSSLTHLRAVEHAATDKVAWAESIGISLSKGEWHDGIFASIRADNGEGKGYLAMSSQMNAGLDLEFTAAWHSRAKNIIESQHLLQHLLVDWRIPGSTMGKMRSRGEKLATDSPFNLRQFQQHRLQGILHRNNVEPATHLLDMEMRRQGVPATRRGVLEYLRETGQVSSAPEDLLALRPSVLPRISAQIRKGGVHLWDPRVKVGERLIPDLVYWDEWLWQQGILTKAGQNPIQAVASMDGACIGVVYLQVGTMWRELKMQTHDPEKRALSLIDWLAISDHDHVRKYLASHQVLESRASIAASIDASANESRGRRSKDKSKEEGKRPKGSLGKRAATVLERETLEAQRLGIGSPRAATPASRPANAPLRVPPPDAAGVDGNSFMDAIRAARAKRGVVDGL